jgi:hypothetical protein
VFDERGLQRMQIFAAAQSGDSGERVSLDRPGEGQTAIDGFAIDQHRTGAAIPLFASALYLEVAKLA